MSHETDNRRVNVCNQKPMAERVEFEIIGQRGGCEWRIWTDGDLVQWRTSHDGDGRHGGEMIEGRPLPRALFILAAKVLAERCESEAHGDGWDLDSKLLHAAGENMVQPIVQAMGWPHGHDPWDAETDAVGDLDDGTRFGFEGQASATSLDKPPECLKGMGEEIAP